MYRQTDASVKPERFLARAANIANVVLGGGGIASVFVFLYALYRYGPSGDRHLSSSMGLVTYFGAPAVVATLLFTTLRLKPVPRIGIAIFCLSVTAFVYGMEFVLFVPEKQGWVEAPRDKIDAVTQLAKRHGVDFDTRSGMEIVTELRSHGIHAVPYVGLVGLARQQNGSQQSTIPVRGAEMVSLAGVANKVTVMCNQSGKHVIYKSDRHGFHNADEIWKVRRLDIAALGNSFAQGYCVSSDSNFVALIRQRRARTLNLGGAGGGPLAMLGTIAEYLHRFEPKFVLWFYFEGNQLTDLQNERKNPILRRYLNEHFTQGLVDHQSEIDRALEQYIDEDTLKKTIRRAKKARNFHEVHWALPAFVGVPTIRKRLGLVFGRENQRPEKFSDAEPEIMNLFREILLRAQRRVAAWGGRFYFVYLPDWDRYANGRPGVAAAQRAKVLALVEGLRIPIIDALVTFESRGDPLSLFPFRRFIHYNEKGHRLVANEVLKVVQCASCGG